MIPGLLKNLNFIKPTLSDFIYTELLKCYNNDFLIHFFGVILKYRNYNFCKLFLIS